MSPIENGCRTLIDAITGSRECQTKAGHFKKLHIGNPFDDLSAMESAFEALCIARKIALQDHSKNNQRLRNYTFFEPHPLNNGELVISAKEPGGWDEFLDDMKLLRGSMSEIGLYFSRGWTTLNQRGDKRDYYCIPFSASRKTHDVKFLYSLACGKGKTPPDTITILRHPNRICVRGDALDKFLAPAGISKDDVERDICVRGQPRHGR